MANRWDRDRFAYERERDRFDDRPPPPGRFEDRPPPRFDDRDDVYSHAPPPRRPREHSDERYDRYPPARPPPGRGFDDDRDFVQDRRYYGDDDRLPPRRDDRDVERRVYIDRERERYASPSPPRRPTMVRRQSSLDTFDRRPLHFLDREPREEYGQMTRREDFRREREREEFRTPPYQPIPLPRTRQLGPARPAPYDDISVAEPGYYGDEEFRTMPERVREREIIRDKSSRRRRDRSRESRTTKTYSHRGSSRSSSTSSRTSSDSGGTAVRSEYPKKGKTRIPARLVSKRALIELGYPFIEEGNTVIVLKALGQDNIDELLKLSEEFKKGELELLEERREEVLTIAPPPPPPAPVVVAPPPAPAPVATPVPVATTPVPPPAPVVVPPPPVPVVAPAPPPPAPVYYEAPPPPPPPAEVVYDRTVIRDVSPTRSVYSSAYTDSGAPLYHEHREMSSEIPVGPMALATRHRSQSRSHREIRAEIKALEAEMRETRISKRHEHRHDRDREIVRAERMPDGALVLFEEKVENVEHGHRPARIEKDKKGPSPGLMRAMLATLT
ncbi:hypothetical protein HYQ44_005463 [Verticillium longisporum]|nr:hypothetical protein HYQ44_005463 [Verticillium longisporum]